jgi:lipopolysaccharide export system permease protein
MTLLRGYLIRAVARGVGTALAVLVGVTVCIELVGQLDDVGDGNYTFSTALAYVALRIPRTVFSTLPAAALIGSLLSLGNLAVHRELTVMRASGISPWQLLASGGLAGFGLAVVTMLLGESLAPSLGAYASAMRSRAVNADIDIADGQSVWVKEGDLILELRREADEAGYAGGVLAFELGEAQALESIARADSVENIPGSDRWVLKNYGATVFRPDRIDARVETEATLLDGLSPDVLELAVVRADLLDTSALRRHIDRLLANGQDARSYQIAFWSRIASVVSVMLLTLLALPVVFGGLRSAGAGARMLVGLIIGLGYYVAGEVLTSSGLVFDLDPRVVAWAPSALLLIVTVAALHRVR